MILRLITITALFFTFPSTTGAQDSAPLTGYTPPPMFGSAPRVTPPEEQPKTKQQTLKAPSPPKKIPAPLKIDSVQKKVAPPKPSKNKSRPQKTPNVPVRKPISSPATRPISKSIVKKEKPSAQEPIKLISKKVKIAPKSKPKSQGIVKGPKTMPAVKKQGVEAEVLFEPTTNTPVNLIDRAQKNTKTPKQATKEKVAVKKPTPSPPAVNESYDLPSFSILPDGNKKLNLIFSEGQASLDVEQKNALNQLIIPMLNENTNMRLRLNAYSSPQEFSVNGDKRTALSRALAIRQHLIKYSIAPNRLDIRPFGAKTDVQPMDRVEIFLRGK